jgi:tetratricopeptide (TPR) repeat protein
MVDSSRRSGPGLLAFVALLIVGAAAFHPVLGAGLLNFDDNLYFGPDNPEFAHEGVVAILDPTRTIANAYLPVAHLSLYFDYVVGGNSPTGIAWAHLHSLLLHVVTAFVLARWIARAGATNAIAVAAAAVFLLHPALVESHAWISGRKDVLSGLFGLLALTALTGDRPRPWLGATLAVLAIYAKATAIVVLPIAVLFVAATGGGRRRFAALVPAAVVLLAATLHHATIAATQGTMQDGEIAGRLTQVPGAYLHYLSTLVWPVDLNVLYPEVATLEVFRARFVPGLVVLIATFATAIGLALRSRTRLAGTAILAVLAALLPFNTAWPASAIAGADRYLYLVVPFAVAALGFGLPPRIAPWLIAAVALLAGWRAHERTSAFRSSEALWQASLATAPQNAVARINLAKAIVVHDPTTARALAETAITDARRLEHRYQAQMFLRALALQHGRVEEAIRLASDVVVTARALPGPTGRVVLLSALLDSVALLVGENRSADAAPLFAEARNLSPEHPRVLLQQAALELMGDAPDRRKTARALLERVRAQFPNDRDAMLMLGKIERGEQNLMAARRWFRAARAADRMAADSYLAEVDLLLEHDSPRDAETLLTEALALGIDDPNLLVRLGISLTLQDRFAEARARFEAYLAARPFDPSVRRLLAEVLATETRRRIHVDPPAALQQAVARIRELDPMNARADVVEAAVARASRDPERAILLLERARERLTDDAEIVRMLAEAHRDLGYQMLMAEPTRDRALEHFKTFLALAPVDPELPTDAVRTALRAGFDRIERRGVDALLAGRLVDAETDFRLCLHLMPEERGIFHQLGLVLWQRGEGHLDEALHCFETAAEHQRARGSDAGLPQLYRVQVLARLGRVDEARKVAAEFLADPGPTPDDLVARVRRLEERLRQ